MLPVASRPRSRQARSRGSCSAPHSAALLAALAMLCHTAAPAVIGSSAAGEEADTFISDTERFPGWKGTLPGVRYAADAADGASGDPNRARRLSHGSLGQVEWGGEVQQLAWEPRLFVYKGFLSDAECDHLMDKARSGLAASEVVDNDTGEGKLDSVRTSSGAFFGTGEDEVIRRIEERIARVSFLPVENGEGLQVLRYVNGQEYQPHHDFFWDKTNADPEHGGQRIATMLMYLTTPEEGGETVFPQAVPKSSGTGWSECAKEGLSVKSTRGDAVLFYALHPNGTTDLFSEHGSCPTTKGEKWSSTKWIHVSSLEQAGGGDEGSLTCQDADKGCEDWAWAGECKKNPGFMLTKCRKSCKVCSKAAAADEQGATAAEEAAAAQEQQAGTQEQPSEEEEGDGAAEERDPADNPLQDGEQNAAELETRDAK